MTIAALDKELKDTVSKYSVYGIESIVNALVRASINEISKENLLDLVDHSYSKEEKRSKDIMHKHLS